jgi:hypothetical protein
MQEIIAAIKLVKHYAWETSFAQRVEEIRQEYVFNDFGGKFFSYLFTERWFCFEKTLS